MPRAHNLITSIVIGALAFVPAVACRSTPDVPPQTGGGPVEPSADSAVNHAGKDKKEPIDLKPVGLGGGPQDEGAGAGSVQKPTPTPMPMPKPTPKPGPKTTPSTSTSPTFTLPPWPSTIPSQWWPFPAPSTSATKMP